MFPRMTKLARKISAKCLSDDKDHRHKWTMLDEIEQLISLRERSTQATYRGILKSWLSFLKTDYRNGSRTFAEATFDDAERFIVYCRNLPAQSGRSSMVSDKCSEETVRKKAIVLSSFYRYLIQCGKLSIDPFARVKKAFRGVESGDRRPTDMTPFTDVELIIEQPGKGKEGTRDRAMLALLFGAALRRSEVVALRIDSFVQNETGNYYLKLRNTKASNYAEQVIQDWALPYVQELQKQRKAEGAQNIDPLFTTYLGDYKPTNRPLSAATLYNLFKKYTRQAGCPVYVTPHSARATSITLLIEMGVPLIDVKEFSRHATIEMVERYHKKKKGIDDSPCRKISFKTQK